MISIELNDFFNWIKNQKYFSFSYTCNSLDFKKEIINYISFKGSKGDVINLSCPYQKRDNECFLRIIRKCLLELDEKIIISYNFKDFLNFIPGNFQCKSKIYDLQILNSIIKNTVEESQIKINCYDKILKNFLRNISEKQLDLYNYILEPAIFTYSKIEKNGIPTKYNVNFYSYYNLVGTVSGRLCNNSFGNIKFINPMNLSKTDRDIVTAPNGYELIIADYNAMEMRVLGFLAQDEKLNEVFERNEDIYMYIGKNIFKINDINIDQRKFIKDLCFLIIYGGTKYGFSKKYECSLDVAEKLIENFFKLFPKTEEWILQTQIEILENKFVESCFGRIRSLDQNEDDFINESILRQGQNFKVQSAANDITISVLNEINETISNESRIIFHVHDSIGILSPLYQSSHNTQVISNIMKNPKKMNYFGLQNICLNPVIEFLSSWR